MQRTNDLLHGALASLIHEKAYDDIVVKEILARANVGRSTFYTHFRDKDELLLSGIRDMLTATGTAQSGALPRTAESVLRFSLPIFEHIERYRAANGAPANIGGLGEVHERLRQVVVDLVADDLRRIAPRDASRRADLPLELLAEYVAVTFVTVLRWWLEREAHLSARAANDRFRALSLPVLTASSASPRQ